MPGFVLLAETWKGKKKSESLSLDGTEVPKNTVLDRGTKK